GIGLEVPHARCYAIDRASLLTIVAPRELGRSEAAIPDEVILVRSPDPTVLREGNGPELVESLWRAAFHARVHQELDRKLKARELTSAMIRERIHRLGETEFDEVRDVLKQDRLLLPPHDDAQAWTEFAATYLELKHFEPSMLRSMFPTIL